MPPPEKDPLRRKKLPIDVVVNEVRKQLNVKQLKSGLALHFVFLLVYILFIYFQSPTLERSTFETGVKALLFDSPFLQSPVLGSTNFIQVKDVQSKDEYWQWVNNIVFPKLFIEPEASNYTKVFDQNYMPFGFRFRQLRVGDTVTTVNPVLSESCEIPEYFKGEPVASNPNPPPLVNRPCIPPYTPLNENKTDYKSYRWVNQFESGEREIVGKMATYPASGVISVLYKPIGAKANNDTLFQVLLNMQQNNFVDERTRAIVHTTTLYNPNFNLLGYVEILLEYTPTGNVYVTLFIESAPYGNLSPGASVNFGLGCASVALMFLLLLLRAYSTYLMTREEIIFDPWTYFDLVYFSVMMAAVVWILDSLVGGTLNLMECQFAALNACDKGIPLPSNCTYAVPNLQCDQVLTSADGLVNYTYQGYYSAYASQYIITYRNGQALYAYLLILATFEMFKYVHVLSIFSRFANTLKRVAYSGFLLCIFYCLCMISYTIAMQIVSGPLNYQTTTFFGSLSFVIQNIAGLNSQDLVYDPIQQVGIALFINIYFIIMFSLLLRILFLAFVIDGWRIESSPEQQKKYGGQIDVVKVLLELVKALFYSSCPCFRKQLDWIFPASTFQSSSGGNNGNNIDDIGNNNNNLNQEEADLDEHIKWMSLNEIQTRIELWRAKRQNENALYMTFDDLFKAMSGDAHNFEQVNEWQVRKLFSLCSDFLTDIDVATESNKKDEDNQKTSRHMKNNRDKHLEVLEHMVKDFKLKAKTSFNERERLKRLVKDIYDDQNTLLAKLKTLNKNYESQIQ